MRGRWTTTQIDLDEKSIARVARVCSYCKLNVVWSEFKTHIVQCMIPGKSGAPFIKSDLAEEHRHKLDVLAYKNPDLTQDVQKSGWLTKSWHGIRLAKAKSHRRGPAEDLSCSNTLIRLAAPVNSTLMSQVSFTAFRHHQYGALQEPLPRRHSQSCSDAKRKSFKNRQKQEYHHLRPASSDFKSSFNQAPSLWHRAFISIPYHNEGPMIVNENIRSRRHTALAPASVELESTHSANFPPLSNALS